VPIQNNVVALHTKFCAQLMCNQFVSIREYFPGCVLILARLNNKPGVGNPMVQARHHLHFCLFFVGSSDTLVGPTNRI